MLRLPDATSTQVCIHVFSAQTQYGMDGWMREFKVIMYYKLLSTTTKQERWDGIVGYLTLHEAYCLCVRNRSGHN